MTADDLAEKVAAVLGAVRSAHSIEVIQGGVGQCMECDEILRVEYGDDGRPLFNPFTRHHLEAQAAALVPLIREREAAAWERALREAADEWDDPSPENVERLRQMALDQYRVGGASMPAIWLRDRAANPYAGSEGDNE